MYLFCNKRGHRMKVLVHDGLGIWLCPAAGTGQISLGSSSPR
ncbi:IS66 family insertion sequence element accessory protein TnpB [Acinetobacter baumannii]|nr:IS66 family insertion sequence element accessory protein TnpB [Acinetobacter baumannii]